MSEQALVLFSGGQDSTTCLGLALQNHAAVETLSFDYGQRHRVELEAQENVRAHMLKHFPHWASKLGQHHVVALPELGRISETSLTRERDIFWQENSLPSTFVPGRNLLFFTYAATLAYRRGLKVLIGGMCETDYSGYPDCRDDTLKALQVTLNLGMDHRFILQTPLMWLTKAQTWALAQQLGGDAFIEMILEHTHTCYLGDRTQRHPWGYGCAACPACQLRAKGYDEWQNQPTALPNQAP